MCKVRGSVVLLSCHQMISNILPRQSKIRATRRQGTEGPTSGSKKDSAGTWAEWQRATWGRGVLSLFIRVTFSFSLFPTGESFLQQSPRYPSPYTYVKTQAHNTVTLTTNKRSIHGLCHLLLVGYANTKLNQLARTFSPLLKYDRKKKKLSIPRKLIPTVHFQSSSRYGCLRV